MEENKKTYVHNPWDLKDFTSEDSFSYRDRPLCFYFTQARYKFAGRMLRRSDRVLDIGCGPGIGTHLLRQFAERVTGADIDRASIEKCRRCFGAERIEFVVANLLDSSFAEEHKGRYDAVVSIDTIEHVSKEDAIKMVHNIHTILPVGGVAVIGTPNSSSAPYASPWRKTGHAHEYSPRELMETLEGVFGRTLLFSMTDETVSTSFPEMAWYLMTVSIKTSGKD